MFFIITLFFMQTMDYLVDGNELVFLYQLIRGKTRSSCAFEVATSTEIDQDLVKRVAEVLQHQGSAHTGREWSTPTTTWPLLPPLKLFLPPLTESNSAEMLYLCDLIMFQLKLSHYSDHPGQNPATLYHQRINLLKSLNSLLHH